VGCETRVFEVVAADLRDAEGAAGEGGEDEAVGEVAVPGEV